MKILTPVVFCLVALAVTTTALAQDFEFEAGYKEFYDHSWVMPDFEKLGK